jgi:hypothetical protein
MQQAQIPIHIDGFGLPGPVCKQHSKVLPTTGTAPRKNAQSAAMLSFRGFGKCVRRGTPVGFIGHEAARTLEKRLSAIGCAKSPRRQPKQRQAMMSGPIARVERAIECENVDCRLAQNTQQACLRMLGYERTELVALGDCGTWKSAAFCEMCGFPMRFATPFIMCRSRPSSPSPAAIAQRLLSTVVSILAINSRSDKGQTVMT